MRERRLIGRNTIAVDADIIGNIRWHNVKLDPDGRIECYTSNPLVSDNFDIVLGFSSDMRLAYVHFDG